MSHPQCLCTASCFSYLITFVESGDPFVWRGYLYAALLFVITILRGIVQQQHMYGKFSIGMRIRSTLNAAVYRKVLASMTTIGSRGPGPPLPLSHIVFRQF